MVTISKYYPESKDNMYLFDSENLQGLDAYEVTRLIEEEQEEEEE